MPLIVNDVATLERYWCNIPAKADCHSQRTAFVVYEARHEYILVRRSIHR